MTKRRLDGRQAGARVTLPGHMDYVRLFKAVHRLGPDAIAIALCLATYRHHEPTINFGLAWPSVGRIETDTRCSRSTVQRRLRELVEAGVICAMGAHPVARTMMYDLLPLRDCTDAAGIGDSVGVTQTPPCHADTGVSQGPGGGVRLTGRGCQADTLNEETKRQKKRHPPNPPLGGGERRSQARRNAVIAAVPPNLDTPEFRSAWTAWLADRSLTQVAAETQLQRLATWGAARAVAAIRHSLAQSYRGIVEERNGQPSAKTQQPRPLTDSELAEYSRDPEGFRVRNGC